MEEVAFVPVHAFEPDAVEDAVDDVADGAAKDEGEEEGQAGTVVLNFFQEVGDGENGKNGETSEEDFGGLLGHGDADGAEEVGHG